MMDGSCSLIYMARSDGRTITCKITSFSISPYVTSLTLVFFLLVLLMAHHYDHHQQINSSYGDKFKRQNISESSTRRDCREKANNAIHFSPIGRKGGRHSFKVYKSPSFSWRDGVFNAGAHEVPSGPNPISNR